MTIFCRLILLPVLIIVFVLVDNINFPNPPLQLGKRPHASYAILKTQTGTLLHQLSQYVKPLGVLNKNN